MTETMRILITGAGGTLGRALAPILAARGDEPVLFDIEPVAGPLASVRGDVRRGADVRRAVAGCDFVVHTAAIHGIHLSNHSAEQFHDLNVTGTSNVWEAAVGAGVRGVVFSSTMGVYGDSRRPPDARSVVALDEDVLLLPADPYALSKVLGEEMCRYYGRRHGVPSIALRVGMFVPEPFFRYGIRLLYGGVDVADVAASVVAALDALATTTTTWDAFNVEAPLPFTDADAADLRADPLPVLERHWPGSAGLLAERGVTQLRPVTERFPTSRIEQRLGFRPASDFGTWLEGLRSRPDERAESDPPWP
jgi:UDP-glucose 4-epimerase